MNLRHTKNGAIFGPPCTCLLLNRKYANIYIITVVDNSAWFNQESK